MSLPEQPPLDPQPEWSGNHPYVTVTFRMRNGIGATYTWQLMVERPAEVRDILPRLLEEWESGQVERLAMGQYEAGTEPPHEGLAGVMLSSLRLQNGDWLVATVPPEWPTDLDRLMASLTALVKGCNLDVAVVALRQGMTLERFGRERVRHFVEMAIQTELDATRSEDTTWRMWPTPYAAERLAEAVIDYALRALTPGGEDPDLSG
jgi:hypothetical protein